MHALVEAGADLIELGVPFSDPMADGPVIQAASERALARGVGLGDVLRLVAEFRRQDDRTPVILMGYLNPLHRFGLSEFSDAAARVGVDGVLMVDAPPEESQSLDDELDRHGLHQIFLLAPTTSEDRMDLICQRAGGFVYYVSLKGVTGAGHLQVGDISNALATIRRHANVPVGVGFGIKTPEDAARISLDADAVVIGSALVSALATAESVEQATGKAREFLRPVREAMDSATSESSSTRTAG
jgi:tryptophan synthase alpha chain